MPAAPPRRWTCRRTWRPGRPVPLRAILGSFGRGNGDPVQRFEADGRVWRVSRTPEGPGTLLLTTHPRDASVEALGWGAGAEWLLEHVPALLGDGDDAEGFRPEHRVIADTARRYAGWRVPRSGLVLESLVPAVLEQKVTGAEAHRAWRRLLHRFGEPAPGPVPAGMRVPLPPEVWRRVPSWEWHVAGVDGKRSRTVVAAAQAAGRLEETVALPRDEADRRLRAVPGVGVWTSAEVTQRAHGDPDAVSVGDYHLAAFVGWALAGAPVDDDGMLELLTPYAGHRYRAVRMLELSGIRKPTFGPRLAARDFTRM